jgi:hypothetical protein
MSATALRHGDRASAESSTLPGASSANTTNRTPRGP